MKFTAKQANEIVGGKLFGDESLEIFNVSKIGEANPGDLTFLYLPAYQKYLKSTKASVVIISPQFERSRTDLTYIEVEKPDAAFQKIIEQFFMPKFDLSGIDGTAFVDPSANLGGNAALGKNVVVGKNCKIGINTKIYHNSVLMDNVQVGDNAIIFPNVTVREDCKIGNSVIIHSGTVIGSDGFGYNPGSDGKYSKVPQIGNVVIEDDVELGSNVSIDRGAVGSTLIKRGTKIDNLVQIAHNVTVGEDTVISAQSGISGSTKIGSRCIIAGQVGFAGHLEIGDNVIIGAQSGISKSLLKPGKYFGYPAKEMSTALRLEAHIRNLPKYSESINELQKRIVELENKLDNKSEESGNA